METARAAASAPDGGPAGLASGLAEAVRLAVSRLSGRARLVTEFAAAAGRDLDRGEVAALPVPQPALAATEALGSGLFRTADGRTGFRHALLAEAVYQEIPEASLVQLHGALHGCCASAPSRPGPDTAASGPPRSPATSSAPGRTSRPSPISSPPPRTPAASPRWRRQTAS